MKYDTNLKGHYFVDAEVLPDRGTLKKMIRESYGDPLGIIDKQSNWLFCGFENV